MRCPVCLAYFNRFQKLTEGDLTTYNCPSCKEPIPNMVVDNFHAYPSAVFSMIGLTGHGKTCFLLSLLSESERMHGYWPGYRYSPMGTMAGELVDDTHHLKQGEVPDFTKAGTAQSVVLRYDQIPFIGNLQLFAFDISGETFEDILRIQEYAKHLEKSETVVWLVSIPSLELSNELWHLLQVYVEGMLQKGVVVKDQSLVIVLTMADVLHREGKFEDGSKYPRIHQVLEAQPEEVKSHGWESLEELSSEVRQWLMVDGKQPQLVCQAEKYFKQVAFAVTSAFGSDTGLDAGAAFGMGHDQGSENEQDLDSEAEEVSASDGEPHAEPDPPTPSHSPKLDPKGVLNVLYWLAKFQLPWVKLTHPGEEESRYYFSLNEAVEAAQDHSEIELQKGVYDLPEPLNIKKPLRIFCQGPDQAVVRCENARHVLFAKGLSQLHLEGIQFIGSETQPNHVVDILECQDVVISRCVFTGGKSDRRARFGDGLILRGGVVAAVSDCHAIGNARHGFAVAGQGSSVSFLHCKSFRNSQGVTFAKGNDCRVEGCELVENRLGGIVVRCGEATLLGNQILRNGEGICFERDSSGEVRENRCEQNRGSGIRLKDDASPHLIANHALENGAEGIQGESLSSLVLEENQCLRNVGSGISISFAGEWSLHENVCRNNQATGISVGGEAIVTLNSNECSANAKTGIRLFENSSGTASHNQCKQNQKHGIAIEGDARWKLDGNTLTDNRGRNLSKPGLFQWG